MRKFLLIVLILLALSAGCLGGAREQSYGELAPRYGDGILIKTKPTITGKIVSDVFIDYLFDWNDNYAIPDNFTAFVIVNNNQRFNCTTKKYRLPTLLEEDWAYVILCEFRVEGEVSSLRLIAIADGVVVANKTIFEEGS